MLVLSRKKSEAIKLTIPVGFSGDLWVKLLEIRGDTVRLGFEAPEEIVIDREEVAIRKETAPAC